MQPEDVRVTRETINGGTMSRAARDASYNNGKAVAESATLNAARIQASQAFRAAHPGHLDLAYGPGERNKWDLYPGTDAAAPCLVFIHGGYSQIKRRDEFDTVGEARPSHGRAIAPPGCTLSPPPQLTAL